jgi:hypothetical protein
MPTEMSTPEIIDNVYSKLDSPAIKVSTTITTQYTYSKGEKITISQDNEALSVKPGDIIYLVLLNLDNNTTSSQVEEDFANLNNIILAQVKFTSYPIVMNGIIPSTILPGNYTIVLFNNNTSIGVKKNIRIKNDVILQTDLNVGKKVSLSSLSTKPFSKSLQKKPPILSNKLPILLNQLPTTSNKLPTTSNNLPTTSNSLPTTSSNKLLTTSSQLTTKARQLPTRSRQSPTSSNRLTTTSVSTSSKSGLSTRLLLLIVGIILAIVAIFIYIIKHRK